MATIEGVYLALFGRPADPGGLTYFKSITNDGRDLSKIGGLTGTAEYLTRFGDMNSTQIVTSIYKMMFNREPEQGGLKYFVGEFDAGRLTIENIAINILDGAQNSDKTIVNNKLEASALFTRSLDLPEEQVLYAGTRAADLGRSYLSGITTDHASVPDQAKTDAVIKSLPPLPAGPFTIQEVLDGKAGTGAYILRDRIQNLSEHPDLTYKADSFSVSNSEGGVGALTVAAANILLRATNTNSFDYSLADSATNILAAMTGNAVKLADTVAVVGSEEADVWDFTYASRGLILSGNGGNDTLVGGRYNDNLRGGSGLNWLSGGGGKDTLTLEASGYDLIRIDKAGFGGSLVNKNDLLYVGNFDRTQDRFAISNADVFTDTGPSFDASDMHAAAWTNPTLPTYTGLHGRSSFDQTSGSNVDSHNIAVYILPILNGNADLGSASDGTLLLRGLTADGSGNRAVTIEHGWSGYLVAYRNNNAYVYWAADAGASPNGVLGASEIFLKAIVTGVAENSLNSDSFYLS